MRYCVVSFLVALLGVYFSAEAANGFGEDNREDASEKDHSSYAAIGRFDNNCTGVLIGKKIVLGPLHCAVNGKSGNILNNLSYFRLNIQNGKSDEKAFVEKVYMMTLQPEENRERDWGLYELRNELRPNIRRPRLRIVDWSRVSLPYQVTMVGFHQDRNNLGILSRVRRCSIVNREWEPRPNENKDQAEARANAKKGRLLHQCFTTSGASGSPALNFVDEDSYIDAMHVMEYRAKGEPTSVRRDTYEEKYANVAIPLNDAYEVFRQIQDAESKGKDVPKMKGVFVLRNPGPPSRGCRMNDREKSPSQAFNPVALDDTAIYDRAKMESHARNHKMGTPIDEARLRADRKGPAWGLTETECTRAIDPNNQANGLVCGAGLTYNVFRVEDGRALGGNANGIAFTSLDTCIRAVQFSTLDHVCVYRGASVVAVNKRTGSPHPSLPTANDFETCLREIRNPN